MKAFEVQLRYRDRNEESKESTVIVDASSLPGAVARAAREFVKRTYAELRLLRKVRVWKDKLHIIDVNKDYFEIRGIGYPDADNRPDHVSRSCRSDPGLPGAAAERREHRSGDRSGQ